MQVILPNQFPNSVNEPFILTSQANIFYNCIAWAYGINNRWLWPEVNSFWPHGIPFNDSVQAFILLFEGIGYQICPDETLEPGFLKVAIFAIGNNVKHAARQLPDGQWTSKLGKNVDVSHSINGMSGGDYGVPVAYLRIQAP